MILGGQKGGQVGALAGGDDGSQGRRLKDEGVRRGNHEGTVRCGPGALVVSPPPAGRTVAAATSTSPAPVRFNRPTGNSSATHAQRMRRRGNDKARPLADQGGGSEIRAVAASSSTRGTATVRPR